MHVREKDPIDPSNVRASAVTAPSTAGNPDLARPRNVAFGSWAAVRHDARMVSTASVSRPSAGAIVGLLRANSGPHGRGSTRRHRDVKYRGARYRRFPERDP